MGYGWNEGINPSNGVDSGWMLSLAEWSMETYCPGKLIIFWRRSMLKKKRIQVSRRDFLMMSAAGAFIAAAGESVATPTVSQVNHEWVLENKHIKVTVTPENGGIIVLDKGSKYLWRQPGEKPAGSTSPIFRNILPLANPENGITFLSDFGAANGVPNTMRVTLSLRGENADLEVTAVGLDVDQQVDDFRFLPAFLLETQQGVLAVTDYCDGHLFSLHMKPFPRTWYEADRLDMPWVGVCDLDKGMGYTLILDTSDDAAVECRAYPTGNGEFYAPQIIWHPQKGRYGYPRRILYRFFSKGGYVAAAKLFRSYAKERGLLVTLEEKAERNPNVRRLFGAVDVWGDASLAFAKEAKALGVEKMLIHGRSKPEEMAAINALGYLTSEYDDYCDIEPLEPGKEPDSNHDLIPQHVVLMADGKRMTAWLTYDKKTQFMKRCPAYWVPTAEIVIPKALSDHPFLGRFIDVTTAEGLYECYDPNHPLCKTDKRHCGQNLLDYVTSLDLVLGGEHGIWWGAPHQNYIEGMMSGGRFFWPAGYLIRPKTKDEKFAVGVDTWEAYEKWGIGHEWRAPLWELVFHDCVIPTWYWGDSNDFLLEAAPEVTPKKNAFNILYGTMPMLWADKGGSWHTNREVFLQTCRNVCHLHEVVASAEMVSHEFVTKDHAVQRTRFSNGVKVVVNFGKEPYSLRIDGQKWLLPQNGFYAKGPGIEQSRAIIDGKIVTDIHAGDYHFTDIEV